MKALADPDSLADFELEEGEQMPKVWPTSPEPSSQNEPDIQFRPNLQKTMRSVAQNGRKKAMT